jgi:hypothetical protein
MSTEKDKERFFHIAHSEIRKDLVGYDDSGNCGRCHGPLEMGFGLAGGGYGAYSYCPKCKEVVDKSKEAFE